MIRWPQPYPVQDFRPGPDIGRPVPRMPDALLSDELTRSATGDVRAFGRVYDGTIGRLFRLALASTEDPERAEVLIRSTYLEAWTTATTFDPQRTSAAAWLAIILRSKCAAALESEPPWSPTVVGGNVAVLQRDGVTSSRRGVLSAGASGWRRLRNKRSDADLLGAAPEHG